MTDLTADTFDCYLLLRPFSDCVAEHRILASALVGLESRFAFSAEGYYSPSLDCALISLRLDREPVEAHGSRQVHARIASAGLPTICPDHLSFEKRCRFFLEHLTLYTTYIQTYEASNLSTIDKTIQTLARHVGVGHGSPATRRMMTTDVTALR